MQKVRPKKQLGQHFLNDENIAKRIAQSLQGHGDYKQVLEVGPGMGVLSKYLMDHPDYQWWGVDVDTESVAYMLKMYPKQAAYILDQDFLKMDFNSMFEENHLAIIGNFPYNISSQILFKMLENRNQVTEMVGMFQKEVAQRVVAKPGGKVGGILSILCQAFYDIEYLFQVDEHVFSPPPKVKSAVIRFQRNNTLKLDCNEKQFFMLVKMAFNQRRKTIRNAVKALNINWENLPDPSMAGKRAEQLSVDQFVVLANHIGH